MKLLALTLILLAGFACTTHAQNVVVTTGEAQREVSRSESREQVERKVEELATINAIEKAFGRVVIQGNSTFMENVSDGRKTQTRSIFSTIANTFVKGEVLEVMDKKIEDIHHDGKVDGKKIQLTDVKCTIKVKVRELTDPPIDFNTHTGPCEDDFVRCESARFKYGDNIYLYFRSPEAGYLNVYADQEGTTSKLLPYSGAAAPFESGIPIRANYDYLFFSKRHNAYDNLGCTGCIPLKAYEAPGKSFESYRLFIMFSKSPVSAPATRESTSASTAVATGEKYNLPASLRSEDFQNWMQRVKMSGAKCNVDIRDITIEK